MNKIHGSYISPYELAVKMIDMKIADREKKIRAFGQILNQVFEAGGNQMHMVFFNAWLEDNTSFPSDEDTTLSFNVLIKPLKP
jgi:hypothetical protein